MNRFFALCAMFFLCTLSLTNAFAQSENNRVFWQLAYSPSLNTDQQAEVQAVVVQTLARAKERHFASDAIIAQKLKKEGLNFPECFEEGIPCSSGGAFLLDVHNVDAYAKALFSYENNEWVITLTLYRALSSSAVQIQKSGPSLPDLLTQVIGSFFEMESSLDITGNVPDIEIYINQKLVGMTPMNIKAPIGEQTITFKKPGYVSETWQFTAEKGKVYSKAVELNPEETQLTVLTSASDAQIYIDDTLWGTANATNAILPGNHKLAVLSETHHIYTQDYKVYPGTPQTIQVASLPKSRSPYEIRHDGIGKYRLSGTLGYFLSGHKLRMPKASWHGEHPDIAEKVYFNGISLAMNYENEYWGVSFFRMDIAGASVDKDFTINNEVYHPDSNALYVGFYPAQIKGHYTFWVMQAEAAFGIGLSHMKLGASNVIFGDADLKQTTFSLDFSLGLKYFFSEESFAMLTYDLQYDAFSNSIPRHGMTLAMGLQFPVWMRTKDLPPEEVELPEAASQEEMENNSTGTEQIEETSESMIEIQPGETDVTETVSIDDEAPETLEDREALEELNEIFAPEPSAPQDTNQSSEDELI